MYKAILALVLLSLFSQECLPSSEADLRIYKTGTLFFLNASRLGLSAEGTMEILGNTKFMNQNVILVRSRVTKIGGLMGFIVKFLRIYKESNTFDSYIDPETFLTKRYEVYKRKDDGSKRLTEDVYFDRKMNRIISFKDNITVASDVAPDIQDAFSIFLSLIHKINTEKIFVGEKFEINLYAYKKAKKVEMEVTDLALVNGASVYTLRMEKIPDVFKYNASVEIKVTNAKDGFMLPISGECTIDIPMWPDITIDGKLSKVR